MAIYLQDAHQYLVTDDLTNNYDSGGKIVICDLPPPHGYAQAAEAGQTLLGKSKEIKRITYKGVTKMALSGQIVVPDATIAPATSAAGKHRNITLDT